jgi:hypothetical protein
LAFEPESGATVSGEYGVVGAPVGWEGRFLGATEGGFGEAAGPLPLASGVDALCCPGRDSEDGRAVASGGPVLNGTLVAGTIDDGAGACGSLSWFKPGVAAASC